MNKRGLGPVVATALLLVVSVVAAVGFHSWFNQYSSSIFSDVEIKANSAVSNTRIEGLIGSNLYFRNGFSSDLFIDNIIVDGVSCNESLNFSGSQINNITLGDCLDNITSSVFEVVVITESGVYSKKLINDGSYVSGDSSLSSIDSNCYNSSNIGLVGSWNGCNGMLIVNRTMLDNAISFNGGVDFYIENGGINYTFGDSEYNIFTGQVTDLSGLFDSNTNFNSDINYWDVSNVVDMSNMFASATSFNQSLDSWDVSSVTNMFAMFFSTNFNQPLNSWNTSSVSNMSDMFAETSSFNQPLDSWDVSGVVDMSYMFSTSSFNQSLSSWDVSGVVDMSYMFTFTSSFNQDLSSWDVSSVIDMSGMFSWSNSFNGNITNWNTSSVINMNSMFRDANIINQDLSSWDVDQVTSCFDVYLNTPQWVLSQPSFSCDTGSQMG